MSKGCNECIHDNPDFVDKVCLHCTWSPLSTHPSLFEPKPQTNYDRIISKTPEELAAWIERIRLCCTTDLCGRSCPLAEICYSNADTPTETLDWLKQEATDGR